MGQCEEHLDYCWHRKVILGHVQILYTCVMIVLLCAAGLIIDAFGELRDQQEQVKEDMEVQSCSVFIFFTHLSCHIDHCFLCRRNASYVALEVTTLIQRRMALRLTLLMNTTWPITCECPSSVLPCIQLGPYILGH